MGGSGSTAKGGLQEATERAEHRVGKVAVSGRYHRLPKRLEDEYDVCPKVLGTGYNGSVVLATGKSDGLKYAVKGFHLHGVSREKLEELESEAEIFLSMDHPHVARLVAVYEDDKMLYLVMECMEGGEVYERVLRLKRFNEKDAAHAVYQMLLAINYIHSKNIVHRDLKLENFLYEKKDGEHLKLIDFGFSKVWERNTKMDLSCGTLSYVAPEVLMAKASRKGYTSQCDLWSLGVVTFILLFGYMPFGGDEARQMNAIKNGQYTRKEEKWRKVSSTAQDFVQNLLVVDPDRRMNPHKALAHTFIAENHNKRPDTTDDIDSGVAEALVSFAEASQFRRACMSVMAWSLTNEERAKVRDAFLKIDTNRTGTITLAELKEVMMKEFDLQDDRVADVFVALDTARNDEIHYSEFLAAMVSTRIAMHDNLLTATFRKFDTDDSGFISLDNLKTVLGDSFSGAEVERLVNEADSNNDGKISYDEFISFLKDGGGTEEHNEAAGKIIDNAHKDGELLRDKNRKGTDKAHGEGHLTLKAKKRQPSHEAQASTAPGTAKKDAGPAPTNGKKSKTCALQ